MNRICFVTTVSCTLDAFVMELSEYLHSTGKYDITFICDDDESFRQRLPGYIHYIPVSMKRGISLGMFRAIGEMRKIFRREKFDLIQYSTPNAAFYASIAAKAENVPVRLYCQWGIRYMGFHGLSRLIFKALEKKTCKNSTAIEPESFSIFDFAVSEKLYSKEKGEVIWNGSACGVNTELYDIHRKNDWRKELRSHFGFNDEDIVYGFAARLTCDKGINELLAGFREAAIPNGKLLVMGGMDDESSINPELLSWARNQPNVIFTGKVSEIYKYYAALDVFLSPSYREGFGLVLIEAQAMGLPVIATDVPGQIDAFLPEKTGIAVPVMDAHAVAAAMARFASDCQLRQHMGNVAHDYVVASYAQDELFRRLEEKRALLIEGGTPSCPK